MTKSLSCGTVGLGLETCGLGLGLGCSGLGLAETVLFSSLVFCSMNECDLELDVIDVGEVEVYEPVVESTSKQVCLTTVELLSIIMEITAS